MLQKVQSMLYIEELVYTTAYINQQHEHMPTRII